jgi:hypothetical protein
MDLTKIEYDGYRAIIEDKDKLKKLMTSQNADGISKFGAECAVYYARCSGALADIKDMIDNEFIRLTKSQEEGGEGMTANKAEKVAEVSVNAQHEATRRQISNLMDAFDKLSFACSSRVRMFERELGGSK